MSIQALNWAFDQDQIEKPGAKFVLVILCNYADESGFCYPSRETIAAKTGIKIRAVQNHLNWLVKEKYIDRESRRYNNKKTSNGYKIRLQKHSANSAHSDIPESAKTDKKHSAKSALNNPELSAKTDKKHSAESAHYTKESKEDTKALSQAESVCASEVEEIPKNVEPLNLISRIPNDFDKTPELETQDWENFRNQVEDGLCKRLKIVELPPNTDTLKNLEWLFKCQFAPEEVLSCFDDLNSQRSIFCNCNVEGKCPTHWRKQKITSAIIVAEIADWKLNKNETKPETVNFSDCPDCHGKGFIEVDRKNALLCRHPNLKKLAEKVTQQVA